MQVYSEEPVVIESLRSFASLSVGGSGFYFHACGLEAGGQALCWGGCWVYWVNAFLCWGGWLGCRLVLSVMGWVAVADW